MLRERVPVHWIKLEAAERAQFKEIVLHLMLADAEPKIRNAIADVAGLVCSPGIRLSARDPRIEPPCSLPFDFPLAQRGGQV